MKVLVTGGVRSGKSVHAEALLDGQAAVTYIAPGDPPDPDEDPDWAARVAAHQSRRPVHWQTVETRELGAAIRNAAVHNNGAAIVDCLGTWVTGVMDHEDLWDADATLIHDEVLKRLDEALAGLGDATGDVVLVTNEVGLGVVPEHRSGRLFRDLLGVVNQRAASICDEVHLVVAGRVLKL